MTENKRPLKVFLFHAAVDRAAVRDLYLRLIQDGVDAWLVKEKLLPGQEWKEELHRVVHEADIVMVCISEGFDGVEARQKDIRVAFDATVEELDEKVFVILVRLETCDRSENLRKWHWVDLFEEDGYAMLIQALQAQANRIGAYIQAKDSSLPGIAALLKQELPISEEKPVEAGQTILDIGTGPSILFERPEMTPQGTLQRKLRHVVLLVLVAFVGSIAAVMLYYSRLQKEDVLASTSNGEATQTSALGTQTGATAAPQPRALSTLVRTGEVSHIIFLIDTSGSMQGQRIRTVKSAVSKFISRLGDDYLVSVIEFDKNVELRTVSTRDHAAVREVIESIVVDVEHNGTCIQDVLYAGIQQASPLPAADGSETIIILVTDFTVGDHLGWDCHMPPMEDMPSFIPNQPMPIYYLYVGDDFDLSFFTPLMTKKGAVLVTMNEKETEAVLKLISEATGLGLTSESIPPTQTTEARDMSMVFIPGGQFIMGSNPVSLNSFWIDKTEVTNEMYARCVQAGLCSVPRSNESHTRSIYYGNPEFENHPVIYVSWEDAHNYCRWVGGHLPTEAQWEKAARGTDGRQFPWGNQDPSGVIGLLNYQAQDTAEVGSFPGGISPYGALDMAGNVSEWVADWFSLDYYNNPPYRNPLGPDSGEYRVWRGGSWATSLTELVSTYSRTGNFPTDSSGGIGFRCARDAGP